MVRNSPSSAKVNAVILGYLNPNFPDALAGIISDLQKEGLQFCRNSGPIGSEKPSPVTCT